jgi:hypothetical protein
MAALSGTGQTMTSDRKKPGVAFWASVVVVVVLAYPLSFGPACWISSRSGTGASVVNSAYQPMLGLAFDGPGVVQRGAFWYAHAFADAKWTVGYVSGRYGWGEMPL